MNCVYKLCLAVLHSVVHQSCCTILSHDTLHHCFSGITVWKTNSQEIFPTAAGAIKNMSPVLLGKCTHLAIGTPVFQVCII